MEDQAQDVADVATDSTRATLPSMAVCHSIQRNGMYPSRGGGSDISAGEAYAGEVRHFTGVPHSLPGDATNGQLLGISQNTVLFSILMNAFGGNGTNEFALPDLRGRTLIGSGQGVGLPVQIFGVPTGETPPALPLSYLIATQAAYPPIDEGVIAPAFSRS